MALPPFLDPATNTHRRGNIGKERLPAGSARPASFLLRRIIYLFLCLVMSKAVCVANGRNMDYANKIHRKLWYACIRGDEPMVAKLIREGANFSYPSADGYTPLILACFYDHKDIALDLLGAGANFEARTKGGWTPLSYAAYWGDLGLTTALLGRGASVDVTDIDGRSVIDNAIVGGNPKVFALILAKTPKSADDPQIEAGRLQEAAFRGADAIFDMLLARGANVNLTGPTPTMDTRDFTPLLAACWGRHWDLAKKLIKAGADINALGYSCSGCPTGSTPLSIATEYQENEMVRYLLASGADPKAHAMLAMQSAEITGNVEAYHLFSAAGATWPPPLQAHPAWQLIRSGTYQLPSAPPAQDAQFEYAVAIKPSLPRPATSNSNGELRVAVIVDDPAVGDSLTVALSHQPGIAILERAEIERVLSEHQLTENGLAQSGSTASLGSLLGADAIISIGRTRTGQKQIYQTRIIAVQTGVVLDSLLNPAPLTDLQGWAAEVTTRVSALKEKLATPPKSAIALAFLNLNAIVGTARGEEIEDELKLLLAHRLVREPRIFVLDRTQMDQLVKEKNLGNAGQFWSGAYLLDGNIDLSLVSSTDMVIHFRLQPALDSKLPSVEFSIQSDRNNLPQCVESAVAKIHEALFRQGPDNTPGWNPNDEAARFSQEADWAEACNLHELAVSAADSSWALGLHTYQVARLRMLARAHQIVDQKLQVEKVVRDRTDNQYICDLLNNPFRDPDTPTPTEYINEGIRLLEASDEAMHTDPGADVRAISDAIGAAGKVFDLIDTASDKIDNAQALLLLKQLLRQLTDEALAKWPDDGGLQDNNIWLSQCFCDTDTELEGRLRETIQHHFQKDDVFNRADVRQNFLPYVRDRVTFNWTHAWLDLGAQLSESSIPEDQLIGSCIQCTLDKTTSTRREAANRLPAEFKSILPLLATDTRAVSAYTNVLQCFPMDFEVSAFLNLDVFNKGDLTYDMRSLPYDDLMRDAFIYLCENSNYLAPGVFTLAQESENIVKINNPDMAVKEIEENLAMMNLALDAHIARVAARSGINPRYLDQLRRSRFTVPPEAYADLNATPATPTPSPSPAFATTETAKSAQLHPLLVTRSWNPADATGIRHPGENRNGFYLSAGSMIWAENRLWFYGELGDDQSPGPEKGYLFAVDMSNLNTETIPLPPFTARLDTASTMAITPEGIYVCRAGEFLGVYDRGAKQWKIYPDIKPRSGYAPLVLDGRLYLSFQTPDQNTGLIEFDHGKVTLLASSRRTPPESPMDIPGAAMGISGTNEQGEISVSAMTSTNGRPSFANWAYSPQKKTWREIPRRGNMAFALRVSAALIPDFTKGSSGMLSPLLFYSGNGFGGRIPIQFKASDGTSASPMTLKVLDTPFGLVFGDFSQLWFASEEELRQAFQSEPVSARYPAGGEVRISHP